MTNLGCFFDEFIGTALLLFGVLSLLDRRNQLTPGFVCVGIFIVFVGIAACFGMQTGFALNPARDLGPRILTSMVGYGTQVFTSRQISSQYWLWSPVIASFAGAQLGTMFSFMVEYAGEFFGTMMLVMFGTAANCQYNLSAVDSIARTPAGTWASVSLGWGAGITLGVLLSGGHINPAVTLAMAVWRGFPWRKVPGYFLCQLLGAICGAAIVYGNYKTAISIKEGGNHIRTLATAGYFGTVPLDYMTNVGCFFDEFIGTALLLFGILSLLDRRNELTPGLVCVGIFIIFVGIAACFGMQTGFAVNPARDLGPRMLTAMVGYGRQVFTLRHATPVLTVLHSQYWLWSPVVGSFTGAQVGTMLYDIFLYSGDQSIVRYL
ncbi:hypothetical protein CVT25_010010 [Psilocybe cyanescens]|uniref:Aquaporin n=1 Tax=Psilocybe cyanescens TaxID=93625 RepID=A0A409X3A6_PSICY|nr:hypothetical protein CVT25_010010 [Psilocybe cyanescens]